TVSSTGALSRTHTFASKGLFTVTETITDKDGGLDTKTFQVVAGTVVVNTNDSGPGSLRQAILYSDASVGFLDTISFAIPGGGVHTITPASVLPTITDAVILDGTTQSGYAGSPLIEIDGSQIPNPVFSTNGLVVSAAGSVIKGLDIHGFYNADVYLNS